jgi:3-phytase
MKTNMLKVVSIFLLLALVQACANSPRVWQQLKPVSGLNAIASVNDSLISVSESDGLFVQSGGAQPQKVLDGEFELLDARSYFGRSLAFSVDAENNIPVLFSLTGEGASLVHEFNSPDFQIDALCLYLNDSGELFSFLLDGYGGGEMRWLLNKGGDKVDASVKTMRLPPGSEACSVDDGNHHLYVLEEDLGVWRYPAQAESAPERALVDIVAPRGNLSSGPLGLRYVSEFGLFVLTKEALWRYDQDLRPSSMLLGEREEPNALVLHEGKLFVFDEETESLISTVNPFAVQVQTRRPEIVNVAPDIETLPVDRIGDAADDPAIWVHPRDTSKSLVLGTNKKWGLHVYSLSGEEVQTLPSGHINNIDLRQGVKLSDHVLDIAVASNRSDNSITTYSISREGEIKELSRIATGLDDVYGICLYSPVEGELYTFINDKDGRYQQWRMSAGEGSAIDATLVREFSLASQPEGCVVNDETAELFVGEEDRGLWLYSAQPDANDAATLLYEIGSILHDDVEGVALIKNSLGNYLVVSSQGNHSYAVFNAVAPYDYIGSFRVGFNAEKLIDGASETDGLDLSGASFGTLFPEGMLVVQDGFNVLPIEAQNFKFISWKRVLDAIQQ